MKDLRSICGRKGLKVVLTHWFCAEINEPFSVASEKTMLEEKTEGNLTLELKVWHRMVFSLLLQSLSVM